MAWQKMPFLAAKKWEMPRTPSMFFPDLVGIVFFLAKNMIVGFDLGDGVIIGLESHGTLQ